LKTKSTIPVHRQRYIIISGEGFSTGHAEIVTTTKLGIKQKITKARCSGSRWAFGIDILSTSAVLDGNGDFRITGIHMDTKANYDLSELFTWCIYCKEPVTSIDDKIGCGCHCPLCNATL